MINLLWQYLTFLMSQNTVYVYLTNTLFTVLITPSLSLLPLPPSLVQTALTLECDTISSIIPLSCTFSTPRHSALCTRVTRTALTLTLTQVMWTWHHFLYTELTVGVDVGDNTQSIGRRDSRVGKWMPEVEGMEVCVGSSKLIFCAWYTWYV